MREDCPYIEGCTIFNEFNYSHTRQVIVKVFCRARYTDCERFKLRELGREVPENLMPTGEKLALYDKISSEPKV